MVPVFGTPRGDAVGGAEEQWTVGPRTAARSTRCRGGRPLGSRNLISSVPQRMTKNGGRQVTSILIALLSAQVIQSTTLAYIAADAGSRIGAVQRGAIRMRVAARAHGYGGVVFEWLKPDAFVEELGVSTMQAP